MFNINIMEYNMLKLIRKHIYESKQVGKIYHFCALFSAEDYIFPNDTLSSAGLFYNRLTRNTNAISFTRNPKFRLNTLRSYDITLRFDVDGDGLSNNYKIMPYSESGVSSPYFKSDGERDYDSDEMEEIVSRPIKNFHKYILGILVSVKNPNITREDLLWKSGFKALIDYITKYNISRNKVDVNFQGKIYKLNEFLVPNINDLNSIFDWIQRKRVSFISELDKKSLSDLFYRIIHELEYDYPYNLISYIDRCKKDLTAQDIKNCRDAFIDAMNLIDKNEVDEVIADMDGIGFGV